MKKLVEIKKASKGAEKTSRCNDIKNGIQFTENTEGVFRNTA